MEAVLEGDKVKKKISHVLLNTSGHCFLCMQDNQTNKEGGADNADLNGGIIDIGNICHYLNINQCSLLSTGLKSNGGAAGVEDFDRHQCTFSVNLCSKCLKLTEKLNEKIIEFVKAKLMVNYHLKSFHKILQGKEEMNTVNNSIEARIAQQLRMEVKDKSLKILKKAEVAMPQVILSNCLAPKPPPLFPTAPSKITPRPHTDKLEKIKRIRKTRQKNKQPIKIVELNKKSAKKSDWLICEICEKILSSIDKLRVHKVTLHQDQLFKECKPGGMGEEEWRGKCKRIFTEEVTRATCGKTGGANTFRCGYCPPLKKRKTSYFGWRYLIAHLVFRHREEMEGKLRGDEEVAERTRSEDDTVLEDCGGGDHDRVVVMEEDGSEFDVKPDVGFGLLLNSGNQEGVVGEEADNNLEEYAPIEYKYFEEVDDNGGMIRKMTDDDEQLVLSSYQFVSQNVKLEVE